MMYAALVTPVAEVEPAYPNVQAMDSESNLTTSDGRGWKYLKMGRYNYVYFRKEEDGRSFVYKLSKYGPEEPTELPKRAVRIWNIINSHLEPAAVELDNGWVVPYIEGSEPSKEEICHALVDIYTQTQRVVTDPAVEGNFIKQGDGRIVCVDIGFALSMDVVNSKSDDSIDCWDKMKAVFDDMLCDADPLIAKTTQALLFLAQNYPEIKNVAVLKQNIVLLNQLSEAYLADALPQNLNLAVYFPDADGCLEDSKKQFLLTKQEVLNEIQSAQMKVMGSDFSFFSHQPRVVNPLHDISKTNNLPSLVRTLLKIDNFKIIEDFLNPFEHPACYKLTSSTWRDILSQKPAAAAEPVVAVELMTTPTTPVPAPTSTSTRPTPW